MPIAEKDVFLHRANSPRGTNTPEEQLQYYVDAGFYRFEVDVFTPTEGTYKFCHAVDADRVSQEHEQNDGYLESIVERFPTAEWLVDLKCVHLPEAPKEMMAYITRVFGSAAIYIGVRQNVLEYYHELGVRTGQYFYRSEEPPQLNFEPDFYTQSAGDAFRFPHSKTIYSCKTFENASQLFDSDFPYLIVESSEVN